MSTDEQRFLLENKSFQSMPESIRQWILQSPNASADFSDFFRQGGSFDRRSDISLPFYSPETPPVIAINASQWEALRQKDAPIYSQLHAFGTLAHEIGHDRYNTGNVLFTGKGADDYVAYRSGLEAQAIFNAFPIFKDLEKNPDFVEMGPPFNSIGYLSGLELGLTYQQWRRGELDDRAVVERIAAQIPERPYTLGGSLRDQNADGRLTHRDAYLSDYVRYLAPKPEPQPPQVGPDRDRPASHETSSPIDPAPSDRALLEKISAGVRGLDQQTGKPWDERSERLSASALSMAVSMKFGAHEDVRVAYNLASPAHAAGESLFVYRVGPTASPDPAANVARMSVADALALPAHEHHRQIQIMRDHHDDAPRQSRPEPPLQAVPAASR